MAAQIGKVSHMQAQFTQSDTIAGMISKSNTFMQSAIGVSDSYTERPPILYTASGSRIVGQLGPHCSTTLLRVISTSSLQNQLLPVISGDVSGMGTDPLEPALYYYHPDHLGSAMVVFSPFPLRSSFPRSIGGHHGTIFAVSSVWGDMAQPAADGAGRHKGDACLRSPHHNICMLRWGSHYLRNAALVSMGAPGLVLVNIREKGKS